LPKRFRSLFEANFHRDLRERKIKAEYEPDRIKYTPKIRTYTPDFYIEAGDFYVETKGYFVSADRTKHLLIKEQHPEIDIRFVFLNANNRLSKKSKTTYAKWCEKYGFKYSEKRLPEQWMIPKIKS
jgi:predicted nuclease of restriction endonuclease-like RecB superfamily|tara:strand:- start:5467 stop:5844 length:378 start_codon:yes stop_codon:yes gene_type:complete